MPKSRRASPDTALIFLFQDSALGPQGRIIDEQVSSHIFKHISKNRKFSGKFGQTLDVALPLEDGYERALVFGLGQKNDFKAQKFIEVGGKAAVTLKNLGVQKCDIFLSQDGLPKECDEVEISLLGSRRPFA